MSKGQSGIRMQQEEGERTAGTREVPGDDEEAQTAGSVSIPDTFAHAAPSTMIEEQDDQSPGVSSSPFPSSFLVSLAAQAPPRSDRSDQPPPPPHQVPRSLDEQLLHFKDQARSHANEGGSSPDQPVLHNVPRSSEKELLHFKDQARSHANSAASGGPSPASRRDDPEEIGPNYKDQMRLVDPPHQRQKQQEPPPGQQAQEPQDNPSSSEPAGGEPAEPDLIQAQVVEEENSANIVTAEAMPGGMFLKRRSILVLATIALLAAIIAGSVCGATGKCRRSGESTTFSVAPTTEVPTVAPSSMPSMAPSSMPTIGTDSVAVIEYINSVRFTTEPITYPAPMDGSATPEELAVHWLLLEDPLQLQIEMDQTQLVQRYSLATLYYGMNGPSWLENSGWLTAEDECTWFGVECSNGNVETIGADGTLEGNNLNGLISPDLALLDRLTALMLSNNPNLRGSLPFSIGNLGLLEVLSLGNCGLSGSLPTTVGDLSSLAVFEITQNSFTGRLPSSIGNWTQLTTFQAGSNSFTYSLPQSIGLWSKIQVRPWSLCL